MSFKILALAFLTTIGCDFERETESVFVTRSADEEIRLVGGGEEQFIDGSKLSFDWVQVSSPAGSSYELRVEGTEAFATFSGPGRYVLDRWVEYRLSSTLTHRYILDIQNSPPKAKIEAPMFGTIGVPLALDASESFDYENGPLQYLWSTTLRPIGSLSVVDDTTAEVTDFVPDKAGEYRIRLDVFDGLDWNETQEEVAIVVL